jgi:hypothetical protein
VVTIDYEIRLAGDVPDEALAHLRDAHLTEQGVESVLRGPVPDQAALIGIINWLQMMGIDLREVRQTGQEEPSEPAPKGDRDPSAGE